MTLQAILRAGYFAFEFGARFNRRVVAGVAVQVVRNLRLFNIVGLDLPASVMLGMLG